MSQARALRRYRWSLAAFLVGLVLSGLTAFPLLHELRLLAKWLGVESADSESLRGWIARVHEGVERTYASYPFLGYGTDWLAFGHLAIAVFFVGPWREPTRYRWTITAGMIACLGVVPLAMICGAIRGIPFGWRLIDCSFGLLGILPLLYCQHLERKFLAVDQRTNVPT